MGDESGTRRTPAVKMIGRSVETTMTKMMGAEAAEEKRKRKRVRKLVIS